MYIDAGLLNDILDAFQRATGGWVLTLFPLGRRLFFLLGSLELSWSGIRFALSSREDAISGFFELFFRKLFYLSFLFWLLEASPAVLSMIIGGFQQAGGVASGLTALRPSTFLATGLEISSDYLSRMNVGGLLTDPFACLVAAFAVFALVFGFAAMAAILTVTLVESYLAIGASHVFLAFAASRWTAPLAQGALVNVFRIAVKLYALYLTSGVILGIVLEWADLIHRTDFFTGPINLLTLVGTVFVLALLLWTIPNYAAKLVPSNFTLNLSPSVGDN
jgi:P-type conjugative transfer protein TrbL